jgi:hypothetical protein
MRTVQVYSPWNLQTSMISCTTERVGSWSPRSAHLLFLALSRFEICQQQCEPHWDFVNTYVLRASNTLCDNPLRGIADTMCWEPQIGWDISQTDFWNVRIDCGFTVEWCGWELFSVFAEFMIWAFIMEMQKSWLTVVLECFVEPKFSRKQHHQIKPILKRVPRFILCCSDYIQLESNAHCS